MEFYFNGAIDSEYKLRGFIDAQGRIVATPFRRAYEHGGVYLFDEVDSSLPSACLAFNAALANGKYDFPGQDEPIARHPNCIVLAASNTWGGPDGGYVGRFRQDAAFMDRFMRIPWETDPTLQRELCSNQDWVAFVQCVRAGAIANGVEHLVSPRATLNGDAMLAAGRPWDRVVDICVRKGLNEADWNKINRTN
jgi:cobaltochelatase CobS